MHPVLLETRWVTFYTYGFFVALAAVAAFFLAVCRSSSAGLGKNEAADLVFLLFVSGVAGARLFYVLQHFESYRHNFWGIFSLQEGGLVWYGGFIVSAASGIAYAFFRKLPVLKLCDFFAPVLAFSHALGRIGCFFNGCCYGRAADRPFGVLFAGQDFPRFPVQLVESVFLFVLSLYLFYLSAKKPAPGTVFFRYLFLYAAFRFFIEFLRGDQELFFWLTIPQWISLGLMGLGVVLCRRSR